MPDVIETVGHASLLMPDGARFVFAIGADGAWTHTETIPAPPQPEGEVTP